MRLASIPHLSPADSPDFDYLAKVNRVFEIVDDPARVVNQFSSFALTRVESYRSALDLIARHGYQGLLLSPLVLRLPLDAYNNMLLGVFSEEILRPSLDRHKPYPSSFFYNAAIGGPMLIQGCRDFDDIRYYCWGIDRALPMQDAETRPIYCAHIYGWMPIAGGKL